MDLERPAFRLLNLLKGEGPDIECTLYQAYLDGDDTIPYDALSYVWGSSEKPSTVTVDGKTLGVTKNLHSALQHLRSANMDRTLWVDAICIDQDNKRERGHQVQQMGKIYRQAEEVVVWLGSATGDTNTLMDSLQQLEERSSMVQHKDQEPTFWTDIWLSIPHSAEEPALNRGLELLLNRSWFKRVWILQEVANARSARVWSGTKSIKAHTLALAPSLLGTEPERHCQAVLDIMPGPLRDKSWWSESRDLYNLLLKFSESEASDPRDKVYALLGISSDAQDTDRLRPDYTKNIQEVVRDTSAFLFGSLDVSCETIPQLLENIASLNTAYFCELVKASDASKVRHFLMRRGLEVPLSEAMIKAAAGNREHGKDIISLMFEQRGSQVKVTEEVIKAAARNEGSGKEIIKLFFRRVIKAIMGSEKKIIQFINAFHTFFPEECRAQGEHYSNILDAALEVGYEKIVKLLLENGADINAQDEYCDSALYAASSKGYEAIVKLLLEKGADVNVRSERAGNYALNVASEGGHEAAVKLLLEKGANPNTQVRPYGDALQTALEGGHEATELPLENAANPNTQGRPYGDALQAASYRGYEAIVKLLLEKGAKVNAQGGYYGNALHAALEGGHETIVKLLLEKGANPNALGYPHGNALQAALKGGHEAIIKLLLEKGAKVNTQALRAAAERGHKAAMERLLEKCADVNAQCGYHTLYAASYRGHEAIVKLLLEKGVHVNTQGGHYGNALQAASYRGYEAIVKLLLEKGAHVNAQGGHYGNALQAASYRGYEAIVKLLLEKGANVNAPGRLHSNALQAALSGGHEAVARLLETSAGSHRNERPALMATRESDEGMEE